MQLFINPLGYIYYNLAFFNRQYHIYIYINSKKDLSVLNSLFTYYPIVPKIPSIYLGNDLHLHSLVK